MTVYDLPPGEAICPFHFHWGDEEWLFVVAGRPSVRTRSGDQILEAGDVVCFPAGPAGAHRVHNASDETVRVALFSNRHECGIVEYPDSDKIRVWAVMMARSTTSCDVARTSTTGTASSTLSRSSGWPNQPRFE